MPRTRPPYPEEFRREAIRLARLGDKPHSRLAKDLGISDVTLRNWLKEEKAARGESPGVATRARRDHGVGVAHPANRRLRMEPRPTRSRRRNRQDAGGGRAREGREAARVDRGN